MDNGDDNDENDDDDDDDINIEQWTRGWTLITHTFKVIVVVPLYPINFVALIHMKIVLLACLRLMPIDYG